jgi:molybdate transport repressor ModE-like protein
MGLMSAARRHRRYKEVRLQQLRSFCATARLGSLAAAAQALGLAQPTVWEQVHALEREFAAQLVEPYGRGCRLTAEGRLLVELSTSLVAGIDALKQNFEEARSQNTTWLTVAAMPRAVIEDLPGPTVEFQRDHPHVGVRFVELLGHPVAAAIKSGEADLGLTAVTDSDPPSPWLSFELGYEIDVLLVTPKDHPLARRRRVSPHDLLRFPVIGFPPAFLKLPIHAALEKLGVFGAPSRRVEATNTMAIRRYVEMGLGIGLVVGVPSRALSSPGLHERSMSDHFGRVAVNLVWRKGTSPQGSVRTFANTIQAVLGRP